MPDVENPYFEEVAGGVTIGGGREAFSDRATDLIKRREDLVEAYAWAIPYDTAIATLVEHDPLLEICAGGGYWASLVQAAGGVIMPTDIDTGRDTHTTVFEYDAVEAVELEWSQDDTRTLFVCWPPYGVSVATEALEAYGGDTVIYVGEGRGGCTAAARFHETLHNWWTLEDVVEIPTYLGIRDRLEVWQREVER